MNITKEEDIALDEIVDGLKKGKTIVYPTETCYCLGCDASNQKAVDALFAIKGRPKHQSLLIAAPHVHMMMDYVEWSPRLQEIADTYWPGPLTVVVPAKRDCALAKGVLLDEDGTLAFRVSSHPLVSAMTEALGKPIVSTSANTAGAAAPYDTEALQEMFSKSKKQPDSIIDAGALPHRSPSTIIKVIGTHIEVLRQGEIIVQL